MSRLIYLWAVLAMLVLRVSQGKGGALPAEDVSRKEFPVTAVRQMLKETFRKKKLELWEEVFDGRGGGRWAGEGEGGAARHRRDTAQDVDTLLSVEEKDRLDTFIGEMIGCQDMLGLSLGMVKGGVRQGEGYGLANIETAREVDRDTLFGIGSNTKAFAAATMAQLMTSLPPQHRFSFSTPLVDMLGDDFQPGDETRTKLTTLMDVLSHRTGLASADLGVFAGYPSNMTTQDMCRRLQFLPEMAPFRSTWFYSNTLLVLVSRVCEIKAEKPWPELLQEAIFGPLGMNNSFMSSEAMGLDNTALPYIKRIHSDDMFVQQDPRLFDIRPLEAAGAIMTSAEDMTKWLQHLLDTFKGSNSVLRQLFTDRTLLPAYWRQAEIIQTPEPMLHYGYGMGFMTSYYRGHLVHWHTGDFHGYYSIVLLVPDMDTAVYVAVNGPSTSSTSKAVMHLAYFVLELLQGHAPWVNLSMICPDLEHEELTSDDYHYDYDHASDDPQDTNPNEKALLRPIEDYVGVFGHGLLGDLVIVREEERDSLLRMELGRLLVADLIPTDSEFVFKISPGAPIADTKEWEAEHAIIFKSTQRSAPVLPKTTGNDTDKMNLKNKTVTENEVKMPLDQVEMWWSLERYVFKRSVRFHSALQEEVEEMEEEEKENTVTELATVDGSGSKTMDSSIELLVGLLTVFFIVSAM